MGGSQEENAVSGYIDGAEMLDLLTRDVLAMDQCPLDDQAP